MTTGVVSLVIGPPLTFCPQRSGLGSLAQQELIPQLTKVHNSLSTQLHTLTPTLWYSSLIKLARVSEEVDRRPLREGKLLALREDRISYYQTEPDLWTTSWWGQRSHLTHTQVHVWVSVF